MKLALLFTAVLSILAFAANVEFGGHAGILIPTGDVADHYNASPMIGVNILSHMPLFAIEGSISYAFLSDAADLEDFSASMVPILAGARTYSGFVFYGGGLALHIASVSWEFNGEEYDDSDSEFGAYGHVGTILPTGGVDVELSAKYHLVDFDFDAAWFGLSAGVNF